MVGGVLVSFVLAAFSIKYLVDQVIVGVVLNVLVVGLTSFLYSTVLVARTGDAQRAGRVPDHADPAAVATSRSSGRCCSGRPIDRLPRCTSPCSSSGSACYKTRWGLRLRSVGEHPQRADTVGINVNRHAVLERVARGRHRRAGRRVLHARRRSARSTRR